MGYLAEIFGAVDGRAFWIVADGFRESTTKTNDD
jgi:hypothetical protein